MTTTGVCHCTTAKCATHHWSVILQLYEALPKTTKVRNTFLSSVTMYSWSRALTYNCLLFFTLHFPRPLFPPSLANAYMAGDQKLHFFKFLNFLGPILDITVLGLLSFHEVMTACIDVLLFPNVVVGGVYNGGAHDNAWEVLFIRLQGSDRTD